MHNKSSASDGKRYFFMPLRFYSIGIYMRSSSKWRNTIYKGIGKLFGKGGFTYFFPYNINSVLVRNE